MMGMRPRTIMIVAVLFLTIGLVVPFLMTIGVIGSNLLLGFLSYAISTLGLFLGIIGIAANWPRRRE